MAGSNTEPADQWDGVIRTVPKDSKDKIKNSEGSGMKTYNEEQLDKLLNQSAKVLKKNMIMNREMPL